MNIMDTVKAIADIAKKGMNVELQEKIAELKIEVINLKNEKTQLAEDKNSLERQIDELTNGERCEKCGKAGWKLIDSKPHPIFAPLGCLERTFKCSACGFSEKHMYDPSGA